MRPSFSFPSLICVAVLPILAGAIAPSSWQIEGRSPPSKITAAEIIEQLGPQLSAASTIFGQDDDRWENATERWQAAYQPSFSVVVEPATEADVPVVVKYANAQGIPFLAANRRHGSTKTLGKLKNGIEISLSQLTAIEIAEDQESAFFEGGVWDGQVVDALWEQGFVTGTGSCACVSLMGPGLGGGHGRYQGFYGLIIDMLISMNVVLADGSTITVNETSHPDLWWAMRGAGHNFGIVTSFQAGIHRRTVDEWYIKEYVYTQDKLESLFAVLNEQQEDGGQPKELMNLALFTWDARWPEEPVIQVLTHYVGTAEEAAPFLSAFDDVGPLHSEAQSLSYPAVLDATGTGLNSPMCQDGHTNMQFPFGLLKHNITATRQIYDYYSSVTTAQPLFNQSIVVFEAYSLQGVQAVDPDSSAFPHRDDNLLNDVLVTYDPDSSLDDEAVRIGKQITEFWAQGQPDRERHIYVNYAFGDEPLEQMYGSEPWRLERLRAAKAKYDPDNVFRFYNPIIRN
ncbi:FAD binding domain-containing protein [Chaetomium fimeti]|uniref:FAD binding domain-containing protein n=1 Tax=Chaetomium fimeti TaxID=1854472 RepID=A0AAE0HAA3_9PEZI|nr:FAD binding domain-containing protein [Chaetomium fimeti]